MNWFKASNRSISKIYGTARSRGWFFSSFHSILNSAHLLGIGTLLCGGSQEYLPTTTKIKEWRTGKGKGQEDSAWEDAEDDGEARAVDRVLKKATVTGPEGSIDEHQERLAKEMLDEWKRDYYRVGNPHVMYK
jgi:hypothetical protein